MSNYIGGLQNILDSDSNNRADIHVGDIQCLSITPESGDVTFNPVLRVNYNSGNEQICLKRSDDICNFDFQVDSSNNGVIAQRSGTASLLLENTTMASSNGIKLKPTNATTTQTQVLIQKGDGASAFTTVHQFTELKADMNVPDIYLASDANIQNSTGTEIIEFSDALSRIILYTDSAERFNLSSSRADFKQRITAPTGSATNPSYSFFDNENMGFYRQGANRCAITVAGSENFRCEDGASALTQENVSLYPLRVKDYATGALPALDATKIGSLAFNSTTAKLVVWTGAAWETITST